MAFHCNNCFKDFVCNFFWKNLRKRKTTKCSPIRLSLSLLSLFPYGYLCSCYACSHKVISVLVISVPIRLSLFLLSLFRYGYLCSDTLSLFLLSLFPYGYLYSCYLCSHMVISVLVISVPIRLSLFPYGHLCS